MTAAILALWAIGGTNVANAQSTSPSQWPLDLHSELNEFCLAADAGTSTESVGNGLLDIFRNSAARTPATEARLAPVQAHLGLLFRFVANEMGREDPVESCDYVASMMTAVAIRFGFIGSDRERMLVMERGAVEGGMRRYCNEAERERSPYREAFCNAPSLEALNIVFQSEAADLTVPAAPSVNQTF